jgi:hypothetical protein
MERCDSNWGFLLLAKNCKSDLICMSGGGLCVGRRYDSVHTSVPSERPRARPRSCEGRGGRSPCIASAPDSRGLYGHSCVCGVIVAEQEVGPCARVQRRGAWPDSGRLHVQWLQDRWHTVRSIRSIRKKKTAPVPTCAACSGK